MLLLWKPLLGKSSCILARIQIVEFVFLGDHLGFLLLFLQFLLFVLVYLSQHGAVYPFQFSQNIGNLFELSILCRVLLFEGVELSDLSWGLLILFIARRHQGINTLLYFRINWLFHRFQRLWGWLQRIGRSQWLRVDCSLFRVIIMMRCQSWLLGVIQHHIIFFYSVIE